ncbi:MAG: sporulation initiation factor Spo0A C-terminal domain-containing protein [Eubacterium sp.]
MNDTAIDNELHMLGVTKNYKGYRQLKLSVERALEDEFRLQSVSKEIYRPVAELCGCPHYTVERNIRTVTHKIWKSHKNVICEISGYVPKTEPSASELITIIVTDLQRRNTEDNKNCAV